MQETNFKSSKQNAIQFLVQNIFHLMIDAISKAMHLFFPVIVNA